MVKSYALLIQKQEVYVSRADGQKIYRGERNKYSRNDLAQAIVFDVSEHYRDACSFDIEQLKSFTIRPEGEATAADVEAISTLIDKEYYTVVEVIRRVPLEREPR